MVDKLLLVWCDDKDDQTEKFLWVLDKVAKLPYVAEKSYDVSIYLDKCKIIFFIGTSSLKHPIYDFMFVDKSVFFRDETKYGAIKYSRGNTLHNLLGFITYIDKGYADDLTNIEIVNGVFDKERFDKKMNITSMIKDVRFNSPATIIFWRDGTKTVVKCQEGDTFDPEKGLAMAICKKIMGNTGNFNEVFKKWIPENN